MQMYHDMTRMPFVESVHALVGQKVVIQSGMHSKQGTLAAVFQDLVVLEVCQTPFYYRLDEITWIMPL